MWNLPGTKMHNLLRPLPGSLAGLKVDMRLAIEMAVHEQAEREALEGELKELEAGVARGGGDRPYRRQPARFRERRQLHRQRTFADGRTIRRREPGPAKSRSSASLVPFVAGRSRSSEFVRRIPAIRRDFPAVLKRRSQMQPSGKKRRSCNPV